MKQEPFAVEQYMDKYETMITHNMGETCCDSLTLLKIISDPQELLQMKLTFGHITGSPSLKEEISKLYNTVTPASIVITNGAIGANFLSLYSLVSLQDTVLVIIPTYQQLYSVPKMFGAKVVCYRLKFENSFLPDLDELKELVSLHSPSLLIFNNPNNPSGSVAPKSTLTLLVDLCKENDMYFLCDEVYRPLSHNDSDSFSAIDYDYDKIIVTSSMSKAWSLAGIRLGWIILKNQKIIDDVLVKRDYNTISISMIDDYIATEALKKKNFILSRNLELCKTNIDILQKFIDTHLEFLSWVKPNGGSTCFIKLNNINSNQFCIDMAEKYKTLIVPGEVFDFPGYIRVGFGNSTENIKSGLKQIELYLSELKK